jgi:hypothetical protein
MPDGSHWVGTWTTAPAPAETGAFTNQTLRMTMRASLGGNQVRVRISNAYGQRPLALGSVHIALRDTGPAIVASSDRELSFGGATTVTIAAGAVLFSDPVALDLPPIWARICRVPLSASIAPVSSASSISALISVHRPCSANDHHLSRSIPMQTLKPESALVRTFAYLAICRHNNNSSSPAAASAPAR